ncbi:hypothetical protein DL98DRAFT_657892 [Cadophora sp. DSE1049]|nr:hypothetical protein DL98DRAFT_657892 [Cadophora sp. DSE1049]
MAEQTTPAKYIVFCGNQHDGDPKPDRDETVKPGAASRAPQPAKEILHSAVPLLSPNKERMQSDFEPTVIDIASPICISGGACDRKAEEAAHKLQREMLITKPWQEFEMSKTCDRCGRKSGVMLCGGCKGIAYCSKECQTKSWPEHKERCKRARREKAAASGSSA